MNVQTTLGLTSQQIDALKGVLIVLIVVGHNPLVTGAFPGTFEALYSFHVFGFLLLPFWFPVPPLSAALVRDRVVRYLVPHYAFYFAGAVVFALTLARDPLAYRVLAVLAGAVVGSADTVKAGSGLSLFWFLPALLTLTLLRSLAARGVWQAVLIVALVAHLLVGALPEPVHVWTPFGLWIALFTYPLGGLVAWAWPRFVAPRLLVWGLGAGLVWGVTLAYIYRTRSVFNIGELALPSIENGFALVLHDVSAVAAFITLSALCGTALGRSRLLAGLGRASLLIFLIHSFVFQALGRVIGAFVPVKGIGWGLALVIATTAVSYGIALLFSRNAAVERWVTPRSAADWPPTAAQPLPTL